MKEKVAFVCVHNSCRSQIAEVLGKSLVSEIFESRYGDETTDQSRCCPFDERAVSD